MAYAILSQRYEPAEGEGEGEGKGRERTRILAYNNVFNICTEVNNSYY